MNSQKTEEKGIGRRHRQKEVGICRSKQAQAEGKEMGRSGKYAGKETDRARQGNKAVGEKDRWIILILCIKFAAQNKYINKQKRNKK